MVWGLNPNGGMRVSLLHSWLGQSWGPPILLYNGYWGSFLGGGHPPTSSSAVKNEYSYTSTIPLFLHGMLLEDHYLPLVQLSTVLKKYELFNDKSDKQSYRLHYYNLNMDIRTS